MPKLLPHAASQKHVHVVIDTNVVVSGLMKPDRVPGAVLARVFLGRIEMVISTEIYAEYLRVLQRPHLQITRTQLLGLQLFLDANAVRIESDPVLGKLLDETDRPFIECAAMARCPIVTGNTKHFTGLDRHGIKVYTPKDFLAAHP